jgi:hypothetical protein
VGRVEGLVVEPSDRQVTHFLLQHGHLWGAKSVSVPIDSITSLDFDGAHTSLSSKRDINALPEIEVTRHGEGGPAHEPPEG